MYVLYRSTSNGHGCSFRFSSKMPVLYGVKTPQVQPLFPRCLGSSPAPASWLPRNRFPDSTEWSAGVTVPLSLQLPIGVKLRSGGRKSSRLCFLFTFPFIFFSSYYIFPPLSLT